MSRDAFEARYIKPDGTEQIVQLRGTVLREGNVAYDPLRHEHIHCLCCSAEVREHAGKRSRGGSSGAGSKSYFAPVRRHDADCILPLRRPPEDAKEKIDRRKGYRLHINTLDFNATFNEEAGAYDVSPAGRITIADPDLRDREAYAVDDLRGIAAFMRKANPARLADTVVVFRNRAIQWDQFYMPTSDAGAMMWLAEQAKKRQKGEAPPFALLRVETRQHFAEARWGKSTPVPLGVIDAGRTKAGRPHEVHLQIYLDDRRDTNVRWGFSAPGEYLVLGLVRHGLRNERGPAVRDWLNVTIRDPRQILDMKFIENPPEKRVKPAPAGP